MRDGRTTAASASASRRAMVASSRRREVVGFGILPGASRRTVRTAPPLRGQRHFFGPKRAGILVAKGVSQARADHGLDDAQAVETLPWSDRSTRRSCPAPFSWWWRWASPLQLSRATTFRWSGTKSAGRILGE